MPLSNRSTLTQYLIEERRRFPGASGALNALILDVALACKAIARAVADMHEPVEFLSCAGQIALHHHERWDGSGYPDGLSGTAIPLPARLMAIADVFDALISRRVYKEPFPLDEVRRIMAEQRGRHFDPELLDLFLAGYEEFCDIARALPDEPPPT